MTRSTVLRWAGGVLVSILVILLAVFLWLRTSLPDEQGEVALAGIDRPVAIIRDRHGIPTVRAASEHGAYFALGYAHAQDRLWQMDFMRRAGGGRLAEIIGPAALPSDRLMRTLGLYRLAEAEYETLSPEVRAAFDAYASGVNAYLSGHKGAWPIEYYLLRTRPQPWKPADSLVWGRLMALRLAADFREEMLRARLLQRLTPAELLDLWPAYRPGWPERDSAALAPDSLQALAAFSWDAIAATLPNVLPQASASNSWVVDGRNSKSGKPELANDPHLRLEAPAVWYLARIEAPGLTLAGATAPGVPLMIAGHNARVAWGFTSSYLDSQDLFIERVDDGDAGRYVAPDGSLPFTMRTESIAVRGGTTVTMTVRETRHGPVVSDVLTGAADFPLLQNGRFVLALADAGLRPDDKTPEGVYRLNRARNAGEVTAALGSFDTPPQNVTFADVDGNIGVYSVGRVPLRKRPPSLIPVPGWSGEYDWTGFIPFADLPHDFDPPSGKIVAANNRISGENYPFPLAAYWPAPYRARRIDQLLNAMAPLAPAETAAIQLDTVSLAVRDLLPRLLAAPADSGQAKAAHRLLVNWDGDMKRDRPEPLIYSAWTYELGRRLTAQRLGPLEDSFGPIDPMVIDHMLGDAQGWCDDPATEARENCNQAISSSLEEALSLLTKNFGADMSRWRWGAAHRAHFHNLVLGEVPFLRRFANVEIPTDGDDSTVDRGTYIGTDPAQPFAHVHGAGLRAVYDLADLDGSLFMIAPGESGNLLSEHYDDFVTPWRDGAYVLLSGGAEGISRRLTLKPEKP